MSSQSSNRKERTVLDMNTKKRMILLSKQGYKHREIASLFKVGRSTVTKILQLEDKLLANDKGAFNAFRKRLRTTRFDELEARVLEFCVGPDRFQMATSSNGDQLALEDSYEEKLHPLRPELKNEEILQFAAQCATELNLEDFEANNAWLGRFRNKFRLDITIGKPKKKTCIAKKEEVSLNNFKSINLIQDNDNKDLNQGLVNHDNELIEYSLDSLSSPKKTVNLDNNLNIFGNNLSSNSVSTEFNSGLDLGLVYNPNLEMVSSLLHPMNSIINNNLNPFPTLSMGSTIQTNNSHSIPLPLNISSIYNSQLDNDTMALLTYTNSMNTQFNPFPFHSNLNSMKWNTSHWHFNPLEANLPSFSLLSNSPTNFNKLALSSSWDSIRTN